MTYSNAWKLASGSKVQIGSTTYEDATSIAIPGNSGEKIDITTLGSTRKEYAVDILDSPEITVTVPLTGTVPTVGDTVVSVVITLAKLGKTASFSGKILSAVPTAAEIGGKLGLEITIQPTTAVTYA